MSGRRPAAHGVCEGRTKPAALSVGNLRGSCGNTWGAAEGKGGTRARRGASKQTTRARPVRAATVVSEPPLHLTATKSNCHQL